MSDFLTKLFSLEDQVVVVIGDGVRAGSTRAPWPVGTGTDTPFAREHRHRTTLEDSGEPTPGAAR